MAVQQDEVVDFLVACSPEEFVEVMSATFGAETSEGDNPEAEERRYVKSLFGGGRR